MATPILEAIKKAEAYADLAESLEETGCEPTVDPLVIYTDNREYCLRILQRVQQVAVAWCFKKNIAPDGWDLP